MIEELERRVRAREPGRSKAEAHAMDEILLEWLELEGRLL
jgi:hypothetical protein